jgi:DNA gyrase inhibitor GyrI
MSEVIHAIEDLVHWSREQEIEGESRIFQIFHNDPRITPPRDYRTDICMTFTAEIGPNDRGVIPMSLPALRCAHCQVQGPHEAVPDISKEILGRWFLEHGARRRPPLAIWEYLVSMPPPSLCCPDTPLVSPEDFVTACYSPLGSTETG